MSIDIAREAVGAIDHLRKAADHMVALDGWLPRGIPGKPEVSAIHKELFELMARIESLYLEVQREDRLNRGPDA